MGVRVTPDLAKLDTIAFFANNYKQTCPDAVYDGENYVIVYNDMSVDSANYSVVTVRMTTAGTILGTPAVVAPAISPADGQSARIAFDGSRCLAAWNNYAGAVQGRFINAAGQPEGSAFTVQSSGGGRTDVASDGNSYLVVWNTVGYDIHGQLVSGQGQLVGPRITIAAGAAAQLFPSVLFDGRQYLVVWRHDVVGDQRISGQLVGTSGGLIGGNFQVSNPDGIPRWFPVAAASDSVYLVVWHQGYSSYDIYGNIDIDVYGIGEDGAAPAKKDRPSTVRRVSSGLFYKGDYVVFDAGGREIRVSGAPASGVYFLKPRRQPEGAIEKVVVVD